MKHRGYPSVAVDFRKDGVAIAVFKRALSDRCGVECLIDIDRDIVEFTRV
jgi:hypothetical protein